MIITWTEIIYFLLLYQPKTATWRWPLVIDLIDAKPASRLRRNIDPDVATREVLGDKVGISAPNRILNFENFRWLDKKQGDFDFWTYLKMFFMVRLGKFVSSGIFFATTFESLYDLINVLEKIKPWRLNWEIGWKTDLTIDSELINDDDEMLMKLDGPNNVRFFQRKIFVLFFIFSFIFIVFLPFERRPQQP